MESIGLLTPPEYRISMSWSTFCRRPEDWKLRAVVSAVLHEAISLSLDGTVCAQVIDCRSASKTCSRSLKVVSAGNPPKLVELAGSKDGHIALHESLAGFWRHLRRAVPSH